MPDFSLELFVADRAQFVDHAFVAGVDEVGMGALAGPIVAAAVVLVDLRQPNVADARWIHELDDSKKLSPRKRERLCSHILADARAVGVGWASNVEIDKFGLVEAHNQALVRAFHECRRELTAETRQKVGRHYVSSAVGLVAVIDGERLDYLRDDLGGNASVFRDKADALSYSVAAASIVAKVTRDHFMTEMSYRHPGYQLCYNKGYGTPQHLKALEEFGPSSIHRFSFAPIKSGNSLELHRYSTANRVQ